ncbi:MAG: hypothetical protein IT181_22085, partial [Acidobacteria bacterium]|nr:hypothetical protein [Acidobacteriota bacterium]
MIDRQAQREAKALYGVVAEGGLALASTATGYRLVAMRSAAVRRIQQLTGRAAGLQGTTSPECAVLGTPAVLDDIALGIDAATRAWLTAATARWPLAVVAPRNPRSPLLSRAEPFVVARCTSDDGIAACFGIGPLLTAATALAARGGQLLVGAGASVTGTGPNYRLEDVPT